MLERTLGAPGSTCECRRQAWEHPLQSWECWRQAWEPRRQVWEHLESQPSCLGERTPSLGMLLERLEIIATTYCSMIFKTHVLGLYSHVWNYITSQPHMVYLDWLHAVIERILRGAWQCQSNTLSDMICGRDWESSIMHWEAVIVHTWRQQSSESGDTLLGSDWMSLEAHLEAVIERVRRCTLRPWLCKLGGRTRASLEMQFVGHDRVNLQAVLERV